LKTEEIIYQTKTPAA